MAKATKPGAARRPAAASGRTSPWRRPHQELVQQHDHLDHRPGGQRPRLGVGRQRRLQGLTQVDPVRRPAGCRAVRQAGHGARCARVDVLVRGPGSGRDTAIRSLSTAGIEVAGIKDVTPIPHNGCRPKKRRRGTGTKGTKDHHGSLHRTRLPALPPGAHQALPEGHVKLLHEVPRLRGGHRPPQPCPPARRARPRPDAPGVGVSRPAAREGQKARRIYGLLEKQFHNLYVEASRDPRHHR